MLLESSYKKFRNSDLIKIFFTVFTYIIVTGYVKLYWAPRQQISTNSQRKKSENVRNGYDIVYLFQFNFFYQQPVFRVGVFTDYEYVGNKWHKLNNSCAKMLSLADGHFNIFKLMCEHVNISKILYRSSSQGHKIIFKYIF
jgi:hypothetical protein